MLLIDRLFTRMSRLERETRPLLWRMNIEPSRNGLFQFTCVLQQCVYHNQIHILSLYLHKMRWSRWQHANHHIDLIQLKYDGCCYCCCCSIEKQNNVTVPHRDISSLRMYTVEWYSSEYIVFSLSLSRCNKLILNWRWSLNDDSSHTSTNLLSCSDSSINSYCSSQLTS